MKTSTRIGLVATALVLGFLTQRTTAGRPESPLSNDEMVVTFGAGKYQCCEIIATCRGNNTPTCAAFNQDSAACTNGSVSKGYYHEDYSKGCGPPRSCPMCDCTEYKQNANGVKYSCLYYYVCTYTGVECKPFKFSSQVDGGTCADNCP